MDKKTLRKELLLKRKEIPQEKKAIYDKEISKKIIETDFFKKAEQVLVFASTDFEFDTRYIIDYCRLQNKKVFFPLCTDRNGNMEFLKVHSENELQLGMYNILEPISACEKYIQEKNDLVIVPCLSADKNKNRIGYGKGYYDRFLKNFKGVSISPCYNEMIYSEIPTDKFDIKINIIVTDKEVIQ